MQGAPTFVAFSNRPRLASGPPVEGNFDFNVETAPYTNPSGEGNFDFKVEV